MARKRQPSPYDKGRATLNKVRRQVKYAAALLPAPSQKSRGAPLGVEDTEVAQEALGILQVCVADLVGLLA